MARDRGSRLRRDLFVVYVEAAFCLLIWSTVIHWFLGRNDTRLPLDRLVYAKAEYGHEVFHIYPE